MTSNIFTIDFTNLLLLILAFSYLSIKIINENSLSLPKHPTLKNIKLFIFTFSTIIFLLTILSSVFLFFLSYITSYVFNGLDVFYITCILIYFDMIISFRILHKQLKHFK